MIPPSRNFGAGASNITTTDNILDINTTLGAATLTLPSIASWFDLKSKSGSIYDADGLRFTDVSGTAGTNNITFVAAAGDNINGGANIVVNTNGASGVLTPNLENGAWEFSLVGAAAGTGLYDVFGVVQIDNPYATALSFAGLENIYAPNYGADQGFAVSISSLTSIVQTVNFPDLTNVYGGVLFLEINFAYGNPYLTTINMPALKGVTYFFVVGKCPLLNTLNLPLLQKVDYVFAVISESGDALTTVSLPSLVEVGTQLFIGDAISYTSSPLTSITLPVLSNCGNQKFPTTSGFGIAGTQITTLDLSSIVGANTCSAWNNPLLTSITINPALNSIGRNYSGNALPVSEVDNLLALTDASGITGVYFQYNTLVGTFQVGETVTGGTSGATAVIVSNDGSIIFANTVLGVFQVGETITGGTSGATANTTTVVRSEINLSGGTNAIPSATGLVFAANLQAKGWVVSHNV